MRLTYHIVYTRLILGCLHCPLMCFLIETYLHFPVIACIVADSRVNLIVIFNVQIPVVSDGVGGQIDLVDTYMYIYCQAFYSY